MPLDESLINDVLKHVDIVKVIEAYLPVIQKGKNFKAKCPFHNDTDPSLTISPEKQIFKCFVCGTSGNAASFLSQYLHISFIEAIKKAAEICGYHDPRLESTSTKPKHVDEKRETLLKCLKDLTLYYQFALNTPEGKEGLDYLNSRHLDGPARSKYLLGYAMKDGKATIRFLQEKGHSLKTIEDVGIATIVNNVYIDKNKGRAIFPICDRDGAVIGYSARRLSDSDEAKYVNSPETYLFHKSSILYNYHIAKTKAHIAGYVYVLEGFMDVFALAEIGIDSAVAIMGTALTDEHIAMLRELNVEVRLCLDGDLPGQNATMKAGKALSKAGLKYRIVDNQNSPKDPDEILHQDGPEALTAYLNKLVSQVDFALNYYKNSNPLSTIDQKKDLVKEFLPILLSIKSQLELDSYLRKLANVTGFEIDSLRNLLSKARGNDNNKDAYKDPAKLMQTFHPEEKLLRKLLLAEREFLYQMLSNKSAVDFYEQKVGGFYGDVYRACANYVVNFAKDHEFIVPIDIVSSLEMSNLENKNELIKEITNLYLERNHPNICTSALLDDLYGTICNEKEIIFEQDTINQSIDGKDPLEQARILAAFQQRKMRKK